MRGETERTKKLGLPHPEKGYIDRRLIRRIAFCWQSQFAFSSRSPTMPRGAATSIDDIVKSAMEGVVKRTSVAIAKAIAELAAARLEAEIQKGIGGAVRIRARKGRASRARTELTRWAADRRARRVPTFVIEQTGLKTKKAIVAKFGDGVVFEKGKPLPKAK
jgi:hypothetical protein